MTSKKTTQQIEQNRNTECYSYLLKILNYKDSSRNELINKALQKDYTTDQIKEAITLLIGQRFQNDERLVENYVYGYREEKGKKYIKQKLLLRGVSEALIDKHLNQYEESLSDKIMLNIIHKYKINRNTFQYAKDEYITTQKIYQYLYQQGFSEITSPVPAIKLFVEKYYK